MLSELRIKRFDIGSSKMSSACGLKSLPARGVALKGVPLQNNLVSRQQCPGRSLQLGDGAGLSLERLQVPVDLHPQQHSPNGTLKPSDGACHAIRLMLLGKNALPH